MIPACRRRQAGLHFLAPKDNKYDGWVMEFVQNLRKELEATFKKDISIFFDENPYDGLLESHNVDNSLLKRRTTGR